MNAHFIIYFRIQSVTQDNGNDSYVEKKSQNKPMLDSNHVIILRLTVNVSGPKFSIDGIELNSTDLIDDDISTCVELTGSNGCPPNKVGGPI